MSIYGPLTTRIGVLQRTTGFIDLIVRNDPEVLAYRLYGAATLDDAYGDLGGSVGGTGGVLLATAERNTIGRTATVHRIGAAHAVENFKGQTRFQIAVADIPGVADEDIIFVRVQEYRAALGGWVTVAGPVNNGWNVQGPILIVLPPGMLGCSTVTFSVQGAAPSGTLSAVGVKPSLDMSVQRPLPMNLIFYRPAGAICLRNTDAVNSLLFSFGEGVPMISLLPGAELSPGLGSGATGIRELFLASTGTGGCEFDLTVEIDRWEY